MKQAIDVSIIIVSYNTSDLLDACLTSIQKSTNSDLGIETIVVDNGSKDDSVTRIKKKFKDVIVIENKYNAGFAKANNIGLKQARGRFLLLLNSDTELSFGVLQNMCKFMDLHPEAGAATCKVVLPDNSLDPACHRGFPTLWVSATYLLKLERLLPKTKLFGEYHQGYKDLNTIHEVDCISGAFFFVRQSVTAEVGLLDEDYFMYGEDIDWAFRIRSKGWKIFFVPEVTIIHKKKQSGRAHTERSRKIISEIYFHRNNWLFYKKNYSGRYGPIITSIINFLYSVRIYLLEHHSI